MAEVFSTITLFTEGVLSMSSDKLELLNIIRQSDNPEQTILEILEMIISLSKDEPC